MGVVGTGVGGRSGSSPVSPQGQEAPECEMCDEPATKYCQKCAKPFCGDCCTHVHSLKRTRGHKVGPLSEMPAGGGGACSLHAGKPLELACARDECRAAPLACSTCAVTAHAGHRMETIQEAAVRWQAQVDEATASLQV